MAINTYFAYTSAALNFSGGTVSLVPGYDPAQDRVVLEFDDDDAVLEGDLNNNEDGNDADQFGTTFDLAGNVLTGGPGVTMYSEEQYILTSPTGQVITLYRIESDSNPASNFGAGELAGFLPSEPLQPGVTYTFTTVNTTPANDPNYADITGAICFGAGTRISTPLGARDIANLRAGDLIITRDHGLQPIRWIGKKPISATRLYAQPRLRPIVLHRDTFGPGLPDRDLTLSPQHRVLLSGARPVLMFGQREVLAPAASLINDTTIRRDNTLSETTYYHILFDQHQVVYANGLASESFHPGDFALSPLADATRAELLDLFPGLRSHVTGYGPTARQSLTVSQGIHFAH